MSSLGANMETLTTERLRQVLDYDPLTGEFRWRIATSRKIRIGAVAGHIGKAGYRYIRVDGRLYRANRLAFLHYIGRWPYHDAEHENRDRDDNRWENLRDATRSQNIANIAAHKDNKTGLKGVWEKRPGRFQSSITVNGKRKHLGTFDTAEEAHAAYERAAKNVFGKFARAS